MGIRFLCPACGRKLNVKQSLGGKRGYCPHCNAPIDIPPASIGAKRDSDSGDDAALASTATGFSGVDEDLQPSEVDETQANAPVDTAPSPMTPVETPSADYGQAPRAPSAAIPSGAAATSNDPIDSAPHLQWYVLPAGSTERYGPAVGPMMRAWLAEGRVPATALVWRQDWPDWRPAASVFAQLAALAPAPATSAVAAPVAIPSAMDPLTFSTPSPLPGLEPVAAVPAVDDGLEFSTRGRIRKRKRNNQTAIYITLGVLLILTAVLVPVLIIAFH